VSYNITNIELLALDATMKAGDIVLLCDQLVETNKLPEENFLDGLARKAKRICAEGDAKKEIKLENFLWRGCGSGSLYDDVLIKMIVPRITGKIEAIVTWEDSEQMGLFIKDGKAVNCEIKKQLVIPEGLG
jgi:hypothetical protein